ncbi:MAG: glycosyltransferase family 92 protein [Bacteroidales bacterium]|nr:glycosyltransferase family 92 protein [Bacteroidales bacterium]MBR7051613.1 glycosyltransferase family 92 protein [Bacteroidaceae bacterium]
MRTALVGIGRLENRYAVEWVGHHLSIGFDHVIIYDNNHEGEEHFEDVLQPYIEEGRVEVIPYRDRENAQRDAYNEAYWRFSSRFDWLAYFDFDEFLCLEGIALGEFLQGFKDCDAVMIPWLNMTDSGLVRYDPRPVMERFTESTDNGRQQGKCIVRTGIPGALFTKSVHIPYEPDLRCCDPHGRPTEQSRHQPKDTTVAYLKHFSTKTIEEWLTNKWVKGAAGVPYEKFKQQYEHYFFSINERTKEKEDFIKHYTDMEKIALCAIGRRENQYAPEWVEHYRKMGFDHIYIYDNNHEGEEHFEDVLKTYVASGYVTIVDWRDRAEAETQIEAYNHCIQRYRNRYTWMAFFDFDEFLTITDGSDIHTFVESRNRYDCILINWMDMTDNDLVRNDHRPLAERFTQPMDYDRSGIGGDFPENDHVKSIVRCGVYGLEFRKNPHVPTVPAMPCCNAEGKEVKQKARLPYIHKTAYLKHYTTKTIEEWLENKMAKGAAGLEYETFIKTYADFFFKVNERTPEKEAFIKEWYGNGHVSALALGRLGNQMFIACAAMKLAKDTGRQFAGLAYNDTSKKPREWDYPEGQFKTVMKRVKYVEPDTLKGYHRMERGQYLSNGLPVHLPHLDILLNDYFQDARCIDRDDALKLFAPTKAVFATIRRLYGDISDCVCVNVRRGDYIEHERFGFRVLTAEQISTILDIHFADYKRVLFVSDDIPWCRDNFKGERYVFADKHKDGKTWPPAIDLYLQTLCRGNVISNSTFSWWGAYLNSRTEKVVCPWPWFASGSHKPYMPHILPDGWIKHQTDGVRIWVTYHDDKLLKEYDLHDDNRHQLFAVHKPAPLENINDLNPVWSEMVTMWYVWRNRLYSPRVGFGHYRRNITPSRLPYAGECAVYHTMRTRQGETIHDQYARCHNVADIDLMIWLIDKRHGEGNPYTRHLMEGREMVTNCCFVLCWQDFTALGDFLFPLLEDFGEATGCGRDIDKWREKAARDFPDADDTTVNYQMRLPGFLAERLISAYITTNFKYYK